jgi:glycosyltransferase involved in cell wall biosynthesis
MRILVLSQHYAPEVTAARVRVQAFAEGLTAAGHDVDVVCAVPNHPEGVVVPGYRGQGVVRDEINGVRVHHVWVKATPKKTVATRVALYASYAGMAAMTASRLPRPDVILASSPPLPVGAAAAIAAARHRRPWVLDVRDLWPEAAVILGEIPDGAVARAAEVLERRLYRSAASIVTVTEPFRRDIADRCGDPGKVSVIMNGTTATWLDAGAEHPNSSDLDLPSDRFIWAYAGNQGIAQGLATAIEAAAILGDDFQLLLIGDGPLREELRGLAADLPPGRVAFRDLMQPAEAARHLRAADALLVPLDSQPGLEKFVPSKLFDCCAIGRPVIVAAAGEPTRLVEETGAGLPVPPGDPTALAAAVRGLRDDPERAAAMAKAGRDFAAQHLRERQVDQLLGVLEEVAGS